MDTPSNKHDDSITSLRDFIENSLEHVPSQFERNLKWVRELDDQTNKMIIEVNQAMKQYKQATTISERKSICGKIKKKMDKLLGIADDKIDWVKQTYDLIDDNIIAISMIGNRIDPNLEPGPLIGFEMPVDENEPKYCYCHGVSHGEMIGCDNPDCPNEWFHFTCVGLTEKPEGSWFCKDCSQQTKKKAKRRKAKRHY